MPKIDVSKCAEILKKNQIEPGVLRRIIEEMNLAVQPDPGEEKPPSTKKQFVVLVSDPLSLINDDFVAWVLQIPEEESPATVQDRINRASYDFNASRKGQLLPVKSVGESIENVPAKYFREADLWIKTKIPVLVIKTDNIIPKDNSSKI